VQRWTLPEGWVISRKPAHPALVTTQVTARMRQRAYDQLRTAGITLTYDPDSGNAASYPGRPSIQTCRPDSAGCRF
jgi:hypothetical protein